MPLVPGDEVQQHHEHGVAHHNGGDGDQLRGDTQQEGQHRRDDSNGDAAAKTCQQHADSQDGIDAGAGGQLAQGLGQGLQSDQQRQHNGGFGDPANVFTHKDSSFL